MPRQDEPKLHAAEAVPDSRGKASGRTGAPVAKLVLPPERAAARQVVDDAHLALCCCAAAPWLERTSVPSSFCTIGVAASIGTIHKLKLDHHSPHHPYVLSSALCEGPALLGQGDHPSSPTFQYPGSTRLESTCPL